MGVNFKESYFLEDQARSHAVNAVLDVLNEHFHDKPLSDRFPQRYGTSGPDHHALHILTKVIISYGVF
jgi:hypothetical protein